MRVLIVKTSSMGDVIHAMPALTDAKAARPDISFDWCVERAFAPLVRRHPAVDRVIEVALRHWRRSPLSPTVLREVRAARATLRAARYDLVVDAQGLVKSAVLARLTRAPVEGFARGSARETLATYVYRFGHSVATDRHAIARQRLLFGRILGYEPDLARVDYGLAAPPPPAGAPTAVLLHGTSWASKRWPAAAWAELADGLAARGYVPEITWSDDDEERVARAVAAAAPSVRLVPKAPLGAVADRIAAAALVVGCDSGLTHLAAAYGRPTVALFLSTAPGLTGVVGAAARVLTAPVACAPCARKTCPLVPAGTLQPCAAALTPAAVLADVDRLAPPPRR